MTKSDKNAYLAVQFGTMISFSLRGSGRLDSKGREKNDEDLSN